MRIIKAHADNVLQALQPVLDDLAATGAPPPFPLAQLLKAQALHALPHASPWRASFEQYDAQALLRWFLDMDPGEPAPDARLFEHHRARAAESIVGLCFVEAVRAAASGDPALSPAGAPALADAAAPLPIRPVEACDRASET